MKRNFYLKILALFFSSAFLLGCTEDGPRRTGVVAADGTILWDQPRNVTQPLANALSLAGAYYAGRAAGYGCTPHGTATVIVPGQVTGFVYY